MDAPHKLPQDVAPYKNVNALSPPDSTVNYGIKLSSNLKLDSTQSQREYPEAIPNYTSYNAAPVEGEPIYPDETLRNPHLARFVKRGWKDLWAALLFLAVVVMTVIWGVVNIALQRNTAPVTDSSDKDLNSPYSLYIIMMLVITVAVSTVFACGSIALICAFPYQVIYVANVMSLIILVGGAVAAFLSGSIAGGVIILVLGALQLLWFFMARKRIPFSAELLRSASRTVTRYKAIILVNFMLLIGFFVYMIFWSFAALPYVQQLNTRDNKPVNGFIIALYVLIFFWVAQVVPNIMEVTAAGLMATMYFAGQDNMPRNPTLASFRRAMTTSFGSICFGSLVVAAIQFLRWLVEASRNQDNGGNFMHCILDCLLSFVESMVRYFNTYAFVHVAIYGCGYIEGAKRTFALIKQSFYAGLFNDSLVGTTINMLSFAVSVLLGAIMGLVTSNIPIGVGAFFICFVCHVLFLTPVQSGATTIFVCFAEVPEALMRSDPILYRAIHSADNAATNNGAPLPV